MKPLRIATFAAALVAAGLTAACSSTRATSLWRDPARQEPFKRILVDVAGVDAATRRGAEEAVARRPPPGVAVASHQVIPEGEQADAAKVKGRLEGAGFDGVLVCRLAGVEQELTSRTVPGSPGVVGYWGWAHAGPQQTIDVRKVAKVESQLFEVGADRVVWAMSTETVNPTSREAAVDEVAALVVKKLEEAGALGPAR